MNITHTMIESSFGSVFDCAVIFSDENIRNQFVRRVNYTLIVQLFVVLAIVLFFLSDKSLKLFIQDNIFVIVLLAVLLVAYAFIVCYKNFPRRTAPANYIALTLFTLIESFLLGTISAYYDTHETVLGLALCIIECDLTVVYTFQHRFPYTLKNCTIAAAFGMIVLFLINIIVLPMFTPTENLKRVFVTCVVSYMFTVYIIRNTHKMINQCHKYYINSDSYVYAALNVYVEFVNVIRHWFRKLSIREEEVP